MPWNGTGTYIQETPVSTGPTAWTDAKALGDVNITTSDHDFHDQDLADGITNCIAKDGQNAATDNLPMGGFKHTRVANGAADDDYAAYGQLALSSPPVGLSVHALMAISSVSYLGTFTADQLTVCQVFGSISYRLPNVNESINLLTTGIGGMDTGSPPNSGYVAIYVMYNPSTGDIGLLAADATSARQPDIYSGGSRPTGYLASALVAVWPTNSSGRMVVGNLNGRQMQLAAVTAISTSVQKSSPTSLSIASSVPRNAKAIWANIAIATTSSSAMTASIGPDNAVTGAATISTNGTLLISNFSSLLLTTLQVIFYTCTAASGTMTFSIGIYGYTF